MFKGCATFFERKNVFPFHAPLRIFHSLQRVFSKNEKSVKGHELLIVSKTFFLSFFKCLSNITSCYVNVGLGGERGRAGERGFRDYAVRHSVFV